VNINRRSRTHTYLHMVD